MSTFDVVVLGAGPSGSATAITLGAMGKRVAIVDCGGARINGVIQHLPVVALGILDELGLRHRFEAIATQPRTSTLVHWGNRVDLVPDRGRLFDRARLETLLLDRLAETSATVFIGRAGSPSPVGSGWVVPVDDERVHGRVLVEARGHTPAWAHADSTAPSTVALATRWRHAADAAVVVQARSDSWVWAAGLPGEGGMTIELVDSATVAGGAALRERALEVARDGALERLRLADPVAAWVHDATSRFARRPAVGTRVCVGDAASTVDPLTSHGVQAALRSGVHGAAVANTMLDPEADHELARQFLTQRTSETHRSHARHCATVYAEHSVTTSSDFWRSRSGPERELAPRSRRFAATDTVRWDPATTWRPTGALVEGRIVGRTALHHPALDAPMAFVAERPVTDVRACFVDGDRLGPCIDRLAAAGFAGAAHTVAADLLQRGVLRADPDSPAQSTARAAIRSG